MLLPHSSSATPIAVGLLQFTAFLVRHLPAIAPYLPVLVYDNNTAHHVTPIITALLAARPPHVLQLVNTDHLAGHRALGAVNASLVVDLLPCFPHRRHALGDQTRRLVWRRVAVSTSKLCRDVKFSAWNVLEVWTDDPARPPSFRTFTTSATALPSAAEWQTPVATEPELVRTLAWSMFLRGAKKLEAPLGVMDVVRQDSLAGVAMPFVSGWKVGIYKIYGQQLAPAMTYGYLNQSVHYRVQFPRRRPPTRYLDARLVWHYAAQVYATSGHVSFRRTRSIQVANHADPVSYRILVPRIVVPGGANSAAHNQLYLQTIVVAALWALVVVNTVLRCWCRRLVPGDGLPPDGVSLVVQTLFDTFARALGTSAGNVPRGLTTAERQLCCVIAVVSILTGSLFAGALYGELVAADEVRYKYNSVDDVCAAKLQLVYPHEVFDVVRHDDRLINCAKVRYFQRAPLKPGAAFILDADWVDNVDYRAQGYMVLKEAYMTLPTKLYLATEYMEPPIRMLTQRLVEHGLWTALRRAANHWRLMDDMRRRRQRIETVVDDDDDTMVERSASVFEYWWLAFGWTSAAIVFGVEYFVWTP